MPKSLVSLGIWIAAAAVALVTTAVLVQILRNPVGPDSFLPDLTASALTAAAVLLIAFALPLFIRRLRIGTSAWLPWLVGAVSASLSLAVWFLVASGHDAKAAALYEGLRIPKPPFVVQFWDLSLVLKSIDCSSYGFDVYAAKNGCMQDASIYGPGTLWLQHVPFRIFSEDSAPVLGVIAIIVSSLGLVWLARLSSGRGQLVLLIAAIGSPWLLLLERGNFDAFVIWAAVVTVILARRWNKLWSWLLAASILWLMGTWKYYPFALGLMLIPALRIRRGWIVLVAFGLASLGFVLLTWENFRFSASANSGMVDVRDFVVLGRIPLVGRMIDAVPGGPAMQPGDYLVFVLVGLAAVWGVLVGMRVTRPRVNEAMLAIAGSSLFLISIVMSGFGYAYKAVFLLLAVPMLSRPGARRSRGVLYSSLVMLILVGISSIVVWNTTLATIAGMIAAAFAFGASAAVLIRSLTLPETALTARDDRASGSYSVALSSTGAATGR